jgi:hypothetical protein
MIDKKRYVSFSSLDLRKKRIECIYWLNKMLEDFLLYSQVSELSLSFISENFWCIFLCLFCFFEWQYDESGSMFHYFLFFFFSQLKAIVLVVINDSQSIKYRTNSICLHTIWSFILTPTLPRLELGSLYCEARFRIISVCKLVVSWVRHAFLKKIIINRKKNIYIDQTHLKMFIYCSWREEIIVPERFK